jgi:hypothetical protein
MESVELRQKLHHYIENAEERKLQAIFTMVEDEINEYYNHWDDEDFVNELHEREQAYLNGTAKTYTASESASRAREAIKQQSK